MKLTTVKQRQNIVIAYTVANTKETYIFNTTNLFNLIYVSGFLSLFAFTIYTIINN